MRLRSKNKRWLVALLVVMPVAVLGSRCPRGLSPEAFMELEDANVNKYVGHFTPMTSEDVGNGFTKHTWDSDGGDGPICIDGSDFTAFTKKGIPSKLLIFLNGGGACWQNFYFCTVTATQALPPDQPGIFAEEFDPGDGSGVIRNPFRNWSVMFVSYCDGSVFSGDNDVDDPNFPDGPTRYHRGLRNLTAALDLAKQEFPNARNILLSGASAGGVGAAGFAPFVARFVYGNHVKLNVFNDAGPIASNIDLSNPFLTGAALARQADWQFDQFYPASCTECDALGQATEVVKWRLRNDSTVRESFYSTDGDETNRFFLFVPDQATYRDIILSEHDPINEEFPKRYRRFIRSGDDSHTALGTDGFYTFDADGEPLWKWTRNFTRGSRRWIDIVEDFVPLP